MRLVAVVQRRPFSAIGVDTKPVVPDLDKHLVARRLEDVSDDVREVSSSHCAWKNACPSTSRGLSLAVDQVVGEADAEDVCADWEVDGADAEDVHDAELDGCL